MAQADLENAKIQFQRGEFRCIQYTPDKRIIKCAINETVSLMLKKTSKGITVTIRNSSKYVSLTEDIFKFICDAFVSIDFLKSFLEEQ